MFLCEGVANLVSFFAEKLLAMVNIASGAVMRADGSVMAKRMLPLAGKGRSIVNNERICDFDGHWPR
jgi:hypothetical protein